MNVIKLRLEKAHRKCRLGIDQKKPKQLYPFKKTLTLYNCKSNLAVSETFTVFNSVNYKRWQFESFKYVQGKAMERVEIVLILGIMRI